MFMSGADLVTHGMILHRYCIGLIDYIDVAIGRDGQPLGHYVAVGID
jgi:hypothetical protein